MVRPLGAIQYEYAPALPPPLDANEPRLYGIRFADGTWYRDGTGIVFATPSRAHAYAQAGCWYTVGIPHEVEAPSEGGIVYVDIAEFPEAPAV